MKRGTAGKGPVETWKKDSTNSETAVQFRGSGAVVWGPIGGAEGRGRTAGDITLAQLLCLNVSPSVSAQADFNLFGMGLVHAEEVLFRGPLPARRRQRRWRGWSRPAVEICAEQDGGDWRDGEGEAYGSQQVRARPRRLRVQVVLREGRGKGKQSGRRWDGAGTRRRELHSGESKPACLHSCRRDSFDPFEATASQVTNNLRIVAPRGTPAGGSSGLSAQLLSTGDGMNIRGLQGTAPVSSR